MSGHYQQSYRLSGIHACMYTGTTDQEIHKFLLLVRSINKFATILQGLSAIKIKYMQQHFPD